LEHNIRATSADCLADSDFSGSLNHGNQHYIHHADSADHRLSLEPEDQKSGLNISSPLFQIT